MKSTGQLSLKFSQRMTLVKGSPVWLKNTVELLGFATATTTCWLKKLKIASHLASIQLRAASQFKIRRRKRSNTWMMKFSKRRAPLKKKNMWMMPKSKPKRQGQITRKWWSTFKCSSRRSSLVCSHRAHQTGPPGLNNRSTRTWLQRTSERDKTLYWLKTLTKYCSASF